jgi:magnesium chelatase family protein
MVAKRVATAREIQTERFKSLGCGPEQRTNATADGEILAKIAAPDEGGRKLLADATERMKLSARGYHRVLRVARTLADLSGAETLSRVHIAEALSYRRLVTAR